MRPFAVSTSATCREDITTATLLTDSWLLTCADGLVAYDMRQGDRRGAELDLVDYTYDGAVVDGGTRLVGGLGQLTDGDQARHIQF